MRSQRSHSFDKSYTLDTVLIKVVKLGNPAQLLKQAAVNNPNPKASSPFFDKSYILDTPWN